jgi:hypothetical protein
MAKLYVSAFLALSAAALQAQPPSSAVEIQPFVDSVEERKILRNMSACLAKARPRWARQTLAHPYLSKKQVTATDEVLSGRDSCIKGSQVELSLRTSGMVGGLAEHFLGGRIAEADFSRMAKALDTLEALNASEDFALCVASRNPAAARDLALSEPGSAAETEAARKVSGRVEDCAGGGQQMIVDLQSLRAMISVALYRAMTNGAVAKS